MPSKTPCFREDQVSWCANLWNRVSCAHDGGWTPAEVANARAAVDSWSVANPGDGDVRLAGERLQEAYPEEDLDLEEGSPTWPNSAPAPCLLAVEATVAPIPIPSR